MPKPKDCKTKWTDPDYVAESYDAAHEATYFGGEAVPNTSLMVGYCFAYGAPLHYAEQTIWQEPIIGSWGGAPRLVLDEHDWGWQQVQKVVARCLEVSAGKWLTGFPNIPQPNDHLAVLRGTEQFCLDMIDHPDELKRALRQLLDNWYVVYERVRAMLASTQEGMVSWLPVWCPWPRSKTVQSDVSCAISPTMFGEFNLDCTDARADICHAEEKLYFHHSCGLIRDLLPLYRETRTDAVHAFTTPPIGDVTLAEGRELLGNRITIIAGVAPLADVHADPATVRQGVEALLAGAPRDHLILGLTAYPHKNMEQTKAVLEECRPYQRPS